MFFPIQGIANQFKTLLIWLSITQLVFSTFCWGDKQVDHILRLKGSGSSLAHHLKRLLTLRIYVFLDGRSMSIDQAKLFVLEMNISKRFPRWFGVIWSFQVSPFLHTLFLPSMFCFFPFSKFECSSQLQKLGRSTVIDFDLLLHAWLCLEGLPFPPCSLDSSTSDWIQVRNFLQILGHLPRWKRAAEAWMLLRLQKSL